MIDKLVKTLRMLPNTDYCKYLQLDATQISSSHREAREAGSCILRALCNTWNANLSSIYVGRRACDLTSFEEEGHHKGHPPALEAYLSYPQERTLPYSKAI